MARRLLWALLGVLVLTQICYPLTSGGARAGLTVLTVVLGCLLSVSHAWFSRGPRAFLALIGTATLGGFLVEAIGVATGFPFGSYDYSGALGPRLLGVPLIIPLAWTWMAWPAWLGALRLAGAATSRGASGPGGEPGPLRDSAATSRGASGPGGEPGPLRGRVARIAVAAVGLAGWDLFLDPQMVAEGYWRWLDPTPALPGVPGVPIGNYLGWLGFALLLMTALALVGGPSVELSTGDDLPALALWFWTYASSVLAHAVFLGLPASAVWGGVVMGAVVVPLAVRLARRPSRIVA